MPNDSQHTSAAPPDHPADETHASRQQREYEQSGCYPEQGKPFRIMALLAWLSAVIVVLAGVAAILNMLILDSA